MSIPVHFNGSLLNVMGGGVGIPAEPFSAEASQFFDRLLTPPAPTRATLYAALIDALVAGGVWAKIDVLYVFSAFDAGTSLINLKSGTFQGFLDLATVIPVFNIDSGWNDCHAPGFSDVNTGFNPATAGGHFTQNDAMWAVWCIGSTQEDRAALTDVAQLVTRNELIPKFHDGNTYWAVNNNNAEQSVANSGDQSGFWLAQRTASNVSTLYHNDVALSTSANVSAALDNSNMVGDLLLNTLGAMAFGGSLTSGERTTFYQSMNTYMAAV